MCLIAWHWQPDHETPLLLIGNRDEFYARPTQALQWWEDASVLAGRDQQAGGTWLGVNRRGQMAALTNYRDPMTLRDNTPSRGALVADFLEGDWSSTSYLDGLVGRCADYNPFNLLVFDGSQLLGLESRHGRVLSMRPGTGAVSNADFHTPWPKVNGLQRGLEAALAGDQTHDKALLNLLHDDRLAADDVLPQTGIGLARERALSSAFIAAPGYGTRACSIVRIGRDEVSFFEESFSAQGPIGVELQVFRPRV
ncbi:NRDE family protein [Rhodoferax sp. PAMC 29310]|uniref:NRDE family protein n=1 Tax=Rhodoferax sp. PAMC 29310 TaxID=2822760 RepID=UPI001B327C81|nr:NRDE family protein [Rhodoferax sp. PAMC 29310]